MNGMTNMKLLTEINEAMLGLGATEELGEPYTLRKSARAILLDAEGNMATQYLQNYGFHKLPGGGVESGESTTEALKREVLEEVGAVCEITDEVGVVIEYRNKYKMIHISYCYIAKVIGEIGQPALEEGEVEEGQVTLWLPPETVLAKMQTDEPKKFEGHFILKREQAFLEEFLAK